MADLLQRFSGNPFSTPVGQKIERATDPSLTCEDWALNMEICDMINDTEDGARDAVRAIKKRFQQSAGKDYTVFNFALTVLETCVKNCPKRFHVLVTNKDFVQDLVKLIGPKNDPPAEVQEKVLSLIQSWAEAFHGQPDMQGVSIVYNELRNKGIEFPKSTNEPKVPIYTPQRTAPFHVQTSSSHQSNTSTHQLASTSPSRTDSHHLTPSLVTRTLDNSSPGIKTTSTEIYSVHLTPEQMNKLKTELEIVQSNMKVLSEMLTEMRPGQDHRDDLNLLVNLHDTCQLMQKRVVELIEKVANEEVTSELLRINDDLNNLFMRYDRYQKKTQRSVEIKNFDPSSTTANIDFMPSTSSSVGGDLMLSSTTKSHHYQPSPPNVQSLIDFTDEPSTTVDSLSSDMINLKLDSSNQIGNTKSNKSGMTENNGDQEFDMFAQQRSYPNLTSSEQGEPWLANSNNKPSASTENDGLSAPFEEFLARRVAEQSKKPNTTNNYQDTSLI